jgi:hypothetical protein
MDAFFSATLSRPPLEGPLAWVAPALGELVCHGENMRSIFRRRHTVRGHALFPGSNPARGVGWHAGGLDTLSRARAAHGCRVRPCRAWHVTRAAVIANARWSWGLRCRSALRPPVSRQQRVVQSLPAADGPSAWRPHDKRGDRPSFLFSDRAAGGAWHWTGDQPLVGVRVMARPRGRASAQSDPPGQSIQPFLLSFTGMPFDSRWETRCGRTEGAIPSQLKS